MNENDFNIEKPKILEAKLAHKDEWNQQQNRKITFELFEIPIKLEKKENNFENENKLLDNLDSKSKLS